VEHKKLIVGLTGGIGSGKSEVSRRFQLRDVTVVDADEMARVVVEPGEPALAAIAQHFGADILTAAGELDRAQLRAIIFSSADQKHWLENLLHPLINARIRFELNRSDNSPYAILSSPLLLETTQHTLVDRILVIDASEDLQIARASLRDKNNIAQIKAIMATQLAREARLEKADDIIHNHGDFLELDAQVNQLHQQYLFLAKTPG
jgi:dephospho-CoA kinase